MLIFLSYAKTTVLKQLFQFGFWLFLIQHFNYDLLPKNTEIFKNNKTTQIFSKGKGLQQIIHQRKYTNTDKHMKGYSTLLVLKEMEIKTKMRQHFTPTKMDITKKQLVQMLRNWSHHTLLEGMQTDAAIVEKKLVLLQKN